MRVLLSTIGSRGDVQPLVALALALRARGAEPRLCVPPNFADWVASFDLACVTIGPDVRALAAARTATPTAQLSDAQRQQLADATVREQFRVVGAAANGCDVIVGAAALQIAARSVAEAAGAHYVFLGYSPSILPSDDHPPPRMDVHHPLDLSPEENRALWQSDDAQFDARFGAALDEERAKLGLGPVRGVRRYVFTDHPWIVTDPVLAPLPAHATMQARQPGALLLADATLLPDDLDRFLSAGDPPLFFGFGSMRGAPETGRLFVDAARALGRRAIVHRGWADLDAPLDAPDCLTIAEVPYGALFPRVAAVVHHGGIGTTTAAAVAGCPQVVVPHLYDQFWMARRIETLRVGASVPVAGLTASALVDALRPCLATDVAGRAQALAPRIDTGGAERAAAWLLAEARRRR